MKIKHLLFLLAFVLPFNSFAQSFEKGKLIFEAGAGIAIFNTKSTRTYSLGNKDTTEVNTDVAGAGVFPFLVEYGVTDRFGFGGGIRYNSYLRDSSQKNEKVTAIDIAVRPAFHLIKTDHVDLFAAGTLGFSHFSYLSNNINDATLKGNGLQYGLSLVSRFYFSKSFGMFLSYSYNGYNYPKLVLSDNTTNPPEEIKFQLNGSCYGIGLMLAIH